MHLSSRVIGIPDSITMKLNERALQLTEEGKVIYNLSGGQLPIKPLAEFIEKIHHQLNFLKSYQYSPSAGFPGLRKKLLKHFHETRGLPAEIFENGWDVILSNGSKHSIYNALGALIDPGDEVILLAPFWVSYPEMIKFWGGIPNVVKSTVFDGFVPALEDIRKAMTPRTKAIIVNSPNNPSGVHYSEMWMKEFAVTWGNYLDTNESAVHVESFRLNPAFHWADYMAPPSGYQTFNQFFARHVKPGKRPIAAIADNRVLVSPADANFVGAWRINADSTINVNERSVDIKGLRWSIQQLLEGSMFADRFSGGIFTHSALRTFDYHRWHAPIAGKVVEARMIQGQVYLDVTTEFASVAGQHRNVLRAVEGTGYQFVQTRGLVVLDSPVGLVACLPVGMAQVSSVVITAEVGTELHKGEEMGYFQFGGSDFVTIFERASEVELRCEPGRHYRQGSEIGHAHITITDE